MVALLFAFADDQQSPDMSRVQKVSCTRQMTEDRRRMTVKTKGCELFIKIEQPVLNFLQ
jgi:hypothetical protein